MVTAQQLREWALALPGTEEKPHFDRAAFRTKRAIFCSLAPDGLSANLKLSPVDQSVFAELGPGVCFPLPNKWGLQGWTTFVLGGVEAEVMQDALSLAHALAH